MLPRYPRNLSDRNRCEADVSEKKSNGRNRLEAVLHALSGSGRFREKAEIQELEPTALKPTLTIVADITGDRLESSDYGLSGAKSTGPEPLSTTRQPLDM